jgi:peroxiredoxin family protein
MTVELFSFEEHDFIDGCEFVGAASYLDIACEAKINLFV